jgi:hypothetical protein
MNKRICRSRGDEAQISLKTKIHLETPHVVSYFINGLQAEIVITEASHE